MGGGGGRHWLVCIRPDLTSGQCVTWLGYCRALPNSLCKLSKVVSKTAAAVTVGEKDFIVGVSAIPGNTKLCIHHRYP